MAFKIYQGDTVVVEGESPLEITGIDPNTSIESGEYKAVRVEDDRESEPVDVPAFTTRLIEVEGVSLAPRSSSAETGEEGNRQLNATVSPSEANNPAVSYVIAPEADGLSVSDGGRISWSENTPAGEYTTTVSTDDGGHTDTHVLTLTEPEPEPGEEDNNE
ncbi:putative Ig domain-containing protein [Geomicrobium sediminis]|uniref:Phage tail protein n=1 Tax=Geomicrobium sediminis TaxID=1347788 RepID=A0ABS2P6Y7_9BACL|nr:putative Ig domain-containing protein [Geomicrobium sediminis]MBM7631106.1 hypothetical protein [Geomicrobium sediminis]